MKNEEISKQLLEIINAIIKFNNHYEKKFDRIETILINIHEILQDEGKPDPAQKDFEAYMNALKDKHRFTKKFPWNQTTEL